MKKITSDRLLRLRRILKVPHKLVIFLFMFFLCAALVAMLEDQKVFAQNTKAQVAESSDSVVESSMTSQGIIARAWSGGFIVFSVLMILAFMSVITWGVVVAKLFYLRRIKLANADFIKVFWESRSLNDLNSKLGNYPYSPVREVFRSGYGELIKANQLREQSSNQMLAFNAAIENLNRSLSKSRSAERQGLEKFLNVLAISASACPFIGLFGTVWGIMGAFEGIARSGSASLAAVAPGISEALVATAFGLAAAIPAVIGYNLSAGRIRAALSQVDGFSADFMNIVERYLAADKTKGAVATGASVAE